MTNYKSKRPIDGKPPIWIIVDETGKIVNRNPTTDELKSIEKEPRHPRDTRKKSTEYCDICRISFSDAAGHSYREYDKEKNWTGRWICNKCRETYKNRGSYEATKRKNYNESRYWDRCKEKFCSRCGISFDKTAGHPLREYDKEGNWTGKWDCINCYEKFDPNSKGNIIKSIGNRRTENLDPNSSQAKGDIFEELTCRWRSTVSTVPVENLNKKNDNYTRGTPIDHTIDSELGIIQTQGRLYDPYNTRWSFSGIEREWKKKFDVMICYCANKDKTLIERIYIIPFKKEIKDKRKSIGIYKNPNTWPPWYERYRIKDKKILDHVNKIYQMISGA